MTHTEGNDPDEPTGGCDESEYERHLTVSGMYATGDAIVIAAVADDDDDQEEHAYVFRFATDDLHVPGMCAVIAKLAAVSGDLCAGPRSVLT